MAITSDLTRGYGIKILSTDTLKTAGDKFGKMAEALYAYSPYFDPQETIETQQLNASSFGVYQ